MQHIAAETRVYVTETPVSATFSTQIKEKNIYPSKLVYIFRNKNKGAVVGRMRAPTHALARARGAPRHRRRFFWKKILGYAKEAPCGLQDASCAESDFSAEKPKLQNYPLFCV